MSKRKNIELGVLIGLICAIMLRICSFEAACSELKSGVFRLHIIANSDSKPDQQLKLKIRDEILKYSPELFGECRELDAAITNARQKSADIANLANKALADSGADYSARVSVEKCYFDTREYESFTLPAGEYQALVVRLGEAKGKNWWCVLFPAVCLPAAGGELSQSVGSKGTEIAENPQKYVMRFKIAEWYEEIKQRIS